MVETKLVEIKKLKPGSFVLLDDVVFRVTELQTSKPGKHGGAKARITAKGVFKNAKTSVVKPSSSKMKVPVIEKRAAQVLAVSGDIAQVMDLETYETFDLPIPEDMKNTLTGDGGEEVILWVFGTNKKIAGKK